MLTLRWQFQELEAISGRHKGMNTMITGHFNELTELLRNFKYAEEIEDEVNFLSVSCRLFIRFGHS